MYWQMKLAFLIKSDVNTTLINMFLCQIFLFVCFEKHFFLQNLDQSLLSHPEQDYLEVQIGGNG